MTGMLPTPRLTATVYPPARRHDLGAVVKRDERYCEISARRLGQGVLALGDG